MVTGFIGRTAPRALLAELIASPGPAAVFVHGAGGSGKTALLAAFTADAADRGLQVQALEITGATTNREQLARSVDTLLPGRRALLLADDCDHPTVAARWLRYHWSKDLPNDAIVVVASRGAPPLGLHGGVGWPARVEVVGLSDLSPEEAVEFTELAGVDPALRDRVVNLSFGSPLALTVLSQLALTDPDALPVDGLEENMACVGQLLDGIVEPLPGRWHRRALQVCAHLRFTTEDLLAAAIPGDVQDLFEWLRRCPFVSEAQRGLVPTPLVRSLVAADLRWRDMATFRAMHLNLTRTLLTHLENPRPDLRAAFYYAIDALYLRPPHIPALLGIVDAEDWAFFDTATFERYSPETSSELLDAATEQSRPWIEGCLARSIEHRTVFRDRDRMIFAFGAREVFTQETLAESDQLAATVLQRHTADYGPARDGETIAITRADAFAPRLAGHATVYALAWLVHEARSDPTASWEGVVAPDRSGWREALAYFDFHLVDTLDDGLAVFAHDWRRLDVHSLFRMLAEEPWDAGPREPTGVGRRLFLTEAEFTDGVRQAMRDLTSDTRLAANPLVESRVVHAADPDLSPERRLRELIRDEAIGLREEHHDLFRVLEHTYLRPSAPQERIAESMSLPFSTYRRRRNRAVAMIAAALWAQERGIPRD